MQDSGATRIDEMEYLGKVIGTLLVGRWNLKSRYY